MANRLQYARDFNPYSKDVSMDELKKVRRQLAKVMNQRMVRLETTESSISGKAYTYGSHEKMQDYLTKQGRPGRSGKKRFSEVLDPQMSRRQLQKEIRVMQGFEQNESSRVAGQKAIEARRVKTLAEQGVPEDVARSPEFYDFLNSETFEKMSKAFNSDDIREEYVKAADAGLTSSEIMEKFDEYRQKATRMSLKGLQRKLGTTEIKSKGKKKKRK